MAKKTHKPYDLNERAAAIVGEATDDDLVIAIHHRESRRVLKGRPYVKTTQASPAARA